MTSVTFQPHSGHPACHLDQPSAPGPERLPSCYAVEHWVELCKCSKLESCASCLPFVGICIGVRVCVYLIFLLVNQLGEENKSFHLGLKNTSPTSEAVFQCQMAFH